MSERWCTIESDPAVFSELVTKMGVENVSVEEIYSLDEATQSGSESSGLYGLIFLFKWREEIDNRPTANDANTEDLFFAKQVVQNACATQALLSVLLNSDTINLGSQLADLKGFISFLDPESRGLAIGNFESIRLAHNSYARADPFVQEEDKFKNPNAEAEDAYHFIAYVPFRGSVYELDGLKPGPVLLGNTEGSDWWNVAKPAIEERMGRYSASETAFSLLSVCESKSSVLNKELASIRGEHALFPEGSPDATRIIGSIRGIEAQLAEEASKLEMQRQENVRRRHNFTPFILALCQALARSGGLDSCVEKAKERRSAQLASNAGAKKLHM